MTDRKTYQDIPGWFRRIDFLLFTAFLESATEPGDLVEIGVFEGKSAVVIGDHVRDGEKFVVIDIFGDESLLSDTKEDKDNAAENRKYYPKLSLDSFTRNYLSVLPELPVVVQANSTEIVKHVEPSAARFIHVDASHLYAGVAADCRSVKQLLKPGGVVSFDDWRNAQCPGVAAAIWEAVIKDGLIPVATTRNKLYGVYEGADEALAVIRTLVAGKPEFFVSQDHEIMGHTVVRLAPRRDAEKQSPAPAPKRRWFGRG
jgi:hypothetical protein